MHWFDFELAVDRWRETMPSHFKGGRQSSASYIKISLGNIASEGLREAITFRAQEIGLELEDDLDDFVLDQMQKDDWGRLGQLADEMPDILSSQGDYSSAASHEYYSHTSPQ